MTLPDWVSTSVPETSAPLTVESLNRAMAQAASEQHVICDHVVHSEVARRGGMTNCGNCGEIIYIPRPDERG